MSLLCSNATVYETFRYNPASDLLISILFLAYIDEHSPAGAQSMSRARIQQARRGANGLSVSAGREAGFRNVRMLVAGRFPYLIFYRVVEDEVQIIHVRHAARKPWKG